MEFLKDRIAQLLSVLICAGLVLGTVTFVALSGGAVMKRFGFRYEPVWSIVAYFAVVELLPLPAGWISSALPRILWYFGKLPTAVSIRYIKNVTAKARIASARKISPFECPAASLILNIPS